MTEIINSTGPLVLTFFLGHLFYRIGFLTRANADLFLKLFFFLALPSVVLLSIPHIPLTHDLIYYPFVAILVCLGSILLALLCNLFFKLERKTLAVFLIGTSIFNGAFSYPFILTSLGNQAMAYVYLFDFGNMIITFSVAHYIACHYGQSHRKHSMASLNLLKSPPLISLFVAIILNIFKIPIPEIGINVLHIFSGMLTPLVMLSLGIYFSPRIVKAGPLVTVIGIQILGGLALGSLFICIFGLKGIGRSVVQIMTVCPAAMNTLAYASMENIDREFAASIVSYTTIISIFMIPLMIYLIQ